MSRIKGLLLLLTLVFAVAPAGARQGATKKILRASVTPELTEDASKEDVKGIAVYRYDENARKLLLKENQNRIEFSIIEKEQIDLILRALTFEEIDGRKLFIVPNAYIFFKEANSGQIIAGQIVGNWQFLMLRGDWTELYPLPEAGSRLLRDRLTVCPKDPKTR